MTDTAETRAAYREKMQAQIREMEAEINKLVARAQGAKADAKIEYQRQIDELRSKQDALERKLRELDAAGDRAWDDIRTGIESAWDDLKGAVNDAVARFQ